MKSHTKTSRDTWRVPGGFASWRRSDECPRTSSAHNAREVAGVSTFTGGAFEKNTTVTFACGCALTVSTDEKSPTATSTVGGFGPSGIADAFTGQGGDS